MADKSGTSAKKVRVKTVQIWLSNDATKLSLSFGGHKELTTELSTEQVDEMLGAIAQWRIKMTPEVAANYLPKKHVEAFANPSWYTEPELSRGGSIFHFRHPAFGWISSWLPKHEAAKLSDFLRKQCEAEDKRKQSSH